MRKALEKISKELEQPPATKSGDIYPSFSDKRYTPHILDTSNFRPLSHTHHNKRISSVDGGNIEIFRSADTSIHLVRIYFNIFRNNKRELPKNIPQKIDFYALTRAYFNQKDSEIHYKSRLIPINETHEKYMPDEKDLDFSSYDPTISPGIFRTSISSIGEISRRFAEWKITEHIIDHELEAGDIILRDGSLQTGITNESLYSEKAYDKAIKKGILFTGISKTSTMLATSGKSLSSEISDLVPDNIKKSPWTYHPVADSAHPDHRAEIYYVNLNKSSTHAFRFEILKDQKQEAQKAIEELSCSANDISFPGYPYPLIDADMNARVRFREISFHRTMIEKTLKSATRTQLESSAASTDAHSIIDSLI